ncbi:Thiol-disulfide isomerase or thioredoxin [Pedobacter steynii]|uniref:Thiol-disulfide isomerase or thioredoxin n=1 Tax=Pedobacter steynii TaxID=430522 RepID=A0A1G9RXD8_9SPHI|nr:DUF3738 domain-containing protein [Pedobacter steynii]NQX37614.1 DUF3738 domain-containing protein [Pedobacter steynii]SDM27883.1 Thiol-disulfide isomerase or thioredoxin [Pedobacter steynii]
MRKIHIIYLIIFFLTGHLCAQENKTLNVSGKAKLIPNLPALTIGNQLPDFEIPIIIHGTKRSTKSSEFKNQLLIIDFWSIYCSGCVAGLPKMDLLQKEFGNKIKILPVTYESETLVSNFWKKNRNTKNLSLPTVVEDKIFVSYFRHLTIPHEVWVYKGKVIAVTTDQYVNQTNIQKVLNGESINWPEKNDFYSFDGSKEPLFKLDQAQASPSSVIRYTAISGYKEHVNSEGLTGGSGTVRDKTGNTIRTFFLNQSIFSSYDINWRNLIDPSTLIRPSKSITPNQILWEVKDPSRYKYDSKMSYQAEWVRANGICFESLSPDTGQTISDISKSIIDGLNSLLGLNVRWEKRKEKVFILIRTSNKDKLESKTTLTDNKDQLTIKGTIRHFRAVPLSTLIYQLNQQTQNPYIFDESAYTGKVDMDLDIDSWTNISSIKKALQAYDLDLKEEQRLVDKFVFTEIDGGLLKEEKQTIKQTIN